jgi:chemotaxis-related protein WspD
MRRGLHILENGNYCWSEIGVFSAGAPSCPLLEKVVHCQNCEVYSAAGRTLFEREAPGEYAQEWTRGLRLGKPTEQGDSLSLLVFRLGAEWLALTTTTLAEVSDVKAIHSLPHRTDSVLLGLVNVRGRLLLCISLAELLGVDQHAKEAPRAASLAYRRMIVVRSGSDRWAFPVDEIDGVRRFRPRHLREPPVTVAKGLAHFTSSVVEFTEDVLLASERGGGALPFEARQVGHLDHERVFAALRRRVATAGTAEDVAKEAR